MSDKLLTDSIDLIITKQDFIDLMHQNSELQKEIDTVRAQEQQRCINIVRSYNHLLAMKLKEKLNEKI